MATDVNNVELTFKTNAKELVNLLNRIVDSSKKVTASLSTVHDQAQEVSDSLDGVKKSADDSGKSLDESGKKAKESGKKAKESEGFWSKLGRSLKRIFLYRAIRKVLSEIGQSAKEGLTNLYQWSSVVGSLDVSNTKANLDALSSASLYLKNSLGAILGQAIQILTPLFINLGNAIGYALNMVSAFIRALGGNNTYTFAKPDVFSQWKSDIGGATSSAKELRRVLLGFDEVNRLDMETPSGGGGGGGLDTNISDMFDVGVVPQKVKTLAQLFKDLLPIVGSVGTALSTWRISEKVTSTLPKIRKWIQKISYETGNGGLIATSVLGAIALKFVEAYNTNEDFKNGVDLAFALVKEVVEKATEKIVEFGKKLWDAFPDSLKEKIKTILGLISDLGQRLNLVNGFVDRTINFFSSMGKAFEGTGSTISSVLRTLESGFYSLKDVVFGIGGVVGKALEDGIIGKLRSMVDLIDRIAGTNFSSLLPSKDWYETGIQRLTSHDIYSNGAKRKASNISKHASGGFPTTGQLFIARESGAELVGQIGGQTAVANNDQIVSAIEQGVYRAMSQANGNQNIKLNVDGKSLFDIIVARNNSVVRSTNKSPLLV